jgi:Xaa-Pro aminopeptidase
MTIPPADTPASEHKHALLPPPAPLGGFAAEAFKARRDALRAACPDGIVLLRGATEDEVVEGSAGVYRQNASFFYLTGVDTPSAFLVLLPESLPAPVGLRGAERDIKEVLFLPSRDANRELWTGPKLGPGEETQKLTGIASAVAAPRLMPALAMWVRRVPIVYTIAPYGERATESRAHGLMRQVAEHAPVVQFRDCAMAVAGLRVAKSADEIERLRSAVAISIEGQRAARQAIATGAGRREYEVEARVIEAFRSQGAAPAFASIVGGGANATVLHYDQNADLLKEGELVVVDIGARLGHYCGDLTRTYPVGGRFGPRQREVYQTVLDVHRQIVATFKLGEDRLDDLTKRCKELLKESPLRSRDAGGEEKTMEHFMPHSIGHHLGMDVHDVGDGEQPLAPGNVITIEPGLYLPAEGIGVRIEDDYLVTPAGLERIGPPLAVEVEEIEAGMQGDK